MISREAAERVARDFVAREFPDLEGAEEVAVDDAATIEKPYGWLFTYTTVSYLRTRDPGEGLAGAGPLLVLREDGRIIDFPSFHTRESALEAYESGKAP
ncbi:YrhB domain-containing protein [Nonomuraea sp. NPDC059023]|uniref:YrhB domain-containing protein n=1 Tax=unclassified Nonomuraea TaxID=2593643 RepID=UPI003698A96E